LIFGVKARLAYFFFFFFFFWLAAPLNGS